MNRKKYSAEYKLRIIELVEKKGNGVPKIANKYLIDESMIYRWIKEYKLSSKDKEKLFPGQGNIRNMDSRIRKKNEIVNISRKNLKMEPSLHEYFEFIYKNRKKYSIIQMVGIFKINRSSYYKWVKRNKV
jgi:transposase-like protein